MFSPSFAQQLPQTEFEGPAASSSRPLPDLEQAPMRAVWRKRAAEFEEAEYVGSAGSGRCTRLRLKSLVGGSNGPAQAVIEFSNETQRKVR
jgi:hypothetical protein